nr:zinc finger, CCHC-type [Tanacetum cinerariifolium]
MAEEDALLAFHHECGDSLEAKYMAEDASSKKFLWVDSGATVHVCKDRCWFKTYKSLNDRSILYMGNESLTHGRGYAVLILSYRKIVSLFNVLHDPNIRKNLVSSSILNKCGYKQMDVKIAFLNGKLDKDVYMNQPQGFIMPRNENKEFLSSRFSMKDMREANVSLVSTPMDTSEKLMPNNGQAVSQLEYSRVIGCLMYAMTCTRPDITFVVGKLSRYTSNPSTQYWQAIQTVLKYLKKTMDYSLTYSGYPLVLKGYSDARWISNTEDSSSTSGWVFLLGGGGAVSWASKKLTYITSLAMKSKFMVLTVASKETEWLRNLILEIPLWSKPIAPISIRCDNVATLAKAYSQIYNGKSRHLGFRHSIIRELIMNGVESIEFMRSQQNIADHVMKGLGSELNLGRVVGKFSALEGSVHTRSCTSERAEVYYECKEPSKSLKCLWVKSKSIAVTWLEKVVTPLIEPAIKGFAAASAVLKLERLKVDRH